MSGRFIKEHQGYKKVLVLSYQFSYEVENLH